MYTLDQNLEVKAVGGLRPRSPESLEQQPDLPGRTNMLDLDYKVAGMLSYIPLFPINAILSVIWLQTERNNSPFLRFHAIQSLVLTGVAFAGGIAFGLIGGIISLIPVINLTAPILHLCGMAIWVAYFIFSLIAMSKSYSGTLYKIPLIGDFAAEKANQ